MTIKQILSRTAARLAVAALVVLGAATLAVTSAQAAPEANTGADQSSEFQTAGTEHRIYHEQSKLCLDGSVSQGVRLNKCNTNGYQEWELVLSHPGGDGAGAVFRHVQSRLCLDASVEKGVRLNKCNWTTYQQWYRSREGADDLFHSQSHFCLDGSVSQGVRLNTCNDSSYQSWWLI